MGLISRVSSRTYRYFKKKQPAKLQNGPKIQAEEQDHATLEKGPKEGQVQERFVRKEAQKLWHRRRHPAQTRLVSICQVAQIHQASTTKSCYPTTIEGSSFNSPIFSNFGQANCHPIV